MKFAHKDTEMLNGNFYEIILKDFKLKDEDIINVYPFGSKIYKADNYQSDWDFVVVVKDGVVDKDLRKKSFNRININIFQEKNYISLLNKHKTSILECHFLPNEKILKLSKSFNLNLNMEALKLYIINKSLDDWNRAEKSFINGEIDFHKSIFHAIRSLDFTIQIIENKKILNYSSANNYWEDLVNCQFDSWESYNEYFEPIIYNLLTKIKEAK